MPWEIEMFSQSHWVIYVWGDPGGLLLPSPRPTGCFHAQTQSHYIWTLAQDGDPTASLGNLLPVQATIMRTTCAVIAALSPFAGRVLTLPVCACWDSLVPSSLLLLLEQPLEVIFLFILVMIFILTTSEKPNNSPEPSLSSCHEKVWNLKQASKREILKNKPQLSTLVSAWLFWPVTSNRTSWYPVCVENTCRKEPIFELSFIVLLVFVSMLSQVLKEY